MIKTVKELSEFEVHRHAKEFVDRYLQSGSEAAGRYGLENIIEPDTAAEEDLAFWQAAITKEFLRQGYVLEAEEDGNVVVEEKPECA